MKVNIYTLRETLFEGEARSLTIRTTEGEITVLDHHRPLVSLVRPGRAALVASSGERRELPVTSGFLEVTAENETNVLLD